MTRNLPGLSMGAVHLAAPHDHKTACGKWALDTDGSTRRLETDHREEQVSCKTCLRILARR